MDTENKEFLLRDIRLEPEDLYNNIGILDPEGNNLNPLNNKPYSTIYRNESLPTSTSKGWSTLPMYLKHREILKDIYENQVLLITAGTGAGKSVILPKLALHTLNYKGNIAMTFPKQLLAKATSEYAAKTLDVKLGDEIGYKHQGSPAEFQPNENTRIGYFTEGTIINKILQDPLLWIYDMIIIDEAHERSVNIDKLLLFLRRALIKRKGLKLIIVSATVNEQLFIDYFPSSYFKFKKSDGGAATNYPIQEFFIQDNITKISKKEFIDAGVRKVCDILQTTISGDILVFFSGSNELKDGCRLMHEYLNSITSKINNSTFCTVLSAKTSGVAKDFAIDKNLYIFNIEQTQKLDPSSTGPYKRKVLFATDVAESSVTVDGLIYVIDSGLSKISNYDPLKNQHLLEKKYIADSSHKQRKGRVGRKAPGICFNLFTKEEYSEFQPYRTSPILCEELTETILELLCYKSDDSYIVTHIDFPINLSDEKINEQKKNAVLFNIMNDEPTTFNDFLYEFIELPSEKTLQYNIMRLYYLDTISLTNNIGIISEVGIIINNINIIIPIEMKRALLSSYNYNCVKELCAIAACIDKIGNTVSNLFIYEDLKEIIEIWDVSNGEFLLMLDVFLQYELREHDTFEIVNGKKIKTPALGQPKQWCKKNKVNYELITKIYDSYVNIKRTIDRIIKTDIEKFKLENPELLVDEHYVMFKDTKPILFESKQLNIIRALMDGYYLNIIKQRPNMQYYSCWPTVSKGSLNIFNSIYNLYDNQSKYLFYNHFENDQGRANYLVTNNIPNEIIRDMITDPKKLEMLEYCLRA